MSARISSVRFRDTDKNLFLQFFPRFPSVQFSVLSTFLSSRLFPFSCRFFRTAFRSVRLPSSLRFFMLRLNFAFPASLSLRCRPFLSFRFSASRAAVIASSRPLSQELALPFRSALALSSVPHLCVSAFRALSSLRASLAGPSPFRFFRRFRFTFLLCLSSRALCFSLSPHSRFPVPDSSALSPLLRSLFHGFPFPFLRFRFPSLS